MSDWPPHATVATVVERDGRSALYELRLVKVRLLTREAALVKGRLAPERVHRIAEVLRGHRDFEVFLCHCTDITRRASNKQPSAGSRGLRLDRRPVFCTLLFWLPRNFRATRFGLVSSYLHLGMYVNKPFEYPDQSAGFGRAVPGLSR